MQGDEPQLALKKKNPKIREGQVYGTARAEPARQPLLVLRVTKG